MDAITPMLLAKLIAALSGIAPPAIDSFNSISLEVAASQADAVLVLSSANKQIWVYGLHLMADSAAGTVQFQDEDNVDLTGVMAVSDEGGWVLPMSGNFAMPWFKLGTNKDLEVDTGSAKIDGVLTYAIVSV